MKSNIQPNTLNMKNVGVYQTIHIKNAQTNPNSPNNSKNRTPKLKILPKTPSLKKNEPFSSLNHKNSLSNLQVMPPAASKTKKASSTSKARTTTPPTSSMSSMSSIKKKPRVTGRPLIKLDTEAIQEKLGKMRQQYEVANSRLIILADRISKHDYEIKCREHEEKLSEELMAEDTNNDNSEEEEEAE